MGWLAVASLFFYGFWDYHALPILLVSIIGNYCFGLTIGSLSVNSAARSWTLATAVILNLVALGFYKYANFAVDVVNQIQPGTFNTLAIVLPIGISFFTFTQIAYLVDIYKSTKPEFNLIRYGLFVTYFPHLIAGPILHHAEMIPQFYSNILGRQFPLKLSMGLTIFAIGLFKKVIIADGFASIANPVFSAASAGPVSTFDAWTGGLAYALQLYFDFSGYSDMAIGISLMFGITLPFNFDAPYKSRSIIEFWRRWHITLSRFLRDYLYIALGGNRRGALIRNVNLFATMLIGGLWHGAGWTFIVWGALHGLFLLINHGWVGVRRRIGFDSVLSNSLPYAVFALLLTQACVVIAWVFFRSPTLEGAGWMLSSMFMYTAAPAGAEQLVSAPAAVMIAVFYLFCFAAPNVNALFSGRNVGIETYKLEETWSPWRLRWQPNLRWALWTVFLMLTALLGILVVGDSTEFLYFQF